MTGADIDRLAWLTEYLAECEARGIRDTETEDEVADLRTRLHLNP